MGERERLLKELERLFDRLQEALPAQSGNPCGTCRECCTAAGLTRHDVTRVELDFIASRVGPERVEAFQRFANRQGDPVCPYYDEGCTIYQHRPFSCRVFGHYRSAGSVLPSVCVFLGREKVASPPEHRAFRRLAEEYWLYAVHRDAQAGPSAESAPANLESEAVTPYARYCRALAHEQAGRLEEAIEELGLALREAPHSHVLHFRLGCNQFSLGLRREALASFEATVRLHPGQAMGWGFLGICSLLLAENGRAREALEQAVALDPHNPVWSLRLHQLDSGRT